MSNRVGVFALQSSNYKSVIRALSHLGSDVSAVNKSSEIFDYSHVVIPGVSAFGSVVKELHELELFETIKSLKGGEIKVLGLCAGMQIMGTGSDESPGVEGLSWFPFRTQALRNEQGKRVFHTGWNSIMSYSLYDSELPVEKGVFYFNHSFFVNSEISPSKDSSFTPFMKMNILASFSSLNIQGVQFHPEKSQISGLNVLKDFVRW